jgi:parvulin-like peptidyl-prolyl isomerase
MRALLLLVAQMVKEFDQVVFSEAPGAVYGPVRSDFGHHLIFIHSCRNPTS